jgi:hypothetical protein
VHDTVDLEQRGIPAVFCATVEFVTGAQAQARALGYDPAAVYTEHPIQDRTDAEMKEISDSVFDQIVAALTE